MAEYLTVAQAAKIAHYTTRNIYYHCTVGNIPSTTKLGVTAIKKDDLTEWIASRQKPTKVKTGHHLYEIILISCGEVSVLFKTTNHRALSARYIELLEHGHRYIRVRKDGEVLTIHDSDKLANVYHPRVKGACDE